MKDYNPIVETPPTPDWIMKHNMQSQSKLRAKQIARKMNDAVLHLDKEEIDSPF